jgi:hypothetical protein
MALASNLAACANACARAEIPVSPVCSCVASRTVVEGSCFEKELFPSSAVYFLSFVTGSYAGKRVMIGVAGSLHDSGIRLQCGNDSEKS